MTRNSSTRNFRARKPSSRLSGPRKPAPRSIRLLQILVVAVAVLLLLLRLIVFVAGHGHHRL